MEYESFQTSHGNLDNVINIEEIAILGWTFLLLAQKSCHMTRLGPKSAFSTTTLASLSNGPSLDRFSSDTPHPAHSVP